jgi:hypothetical protein
MLQSRLRGVGWLPEARLQLRHFGDLRTDKNDAVGKGGYSYIGTFEDDLPLNQEYPPLPSGTPIEAG